MLRRTSIVIAAAALAALYSCNELSVHTREQATMYGSGSAPDAGGGIPDASPGSDAAIPPDTGPMPDAGSGSGQQIRFSVSHHAGNMRDAAAANARLDLLLADDLGGLGVLGYGGCAFDPATVSRYVYPSTVAIYYDGDASSGSFNTTLAHGYVSAQIVCTTGPIPPPDTGPGSDTSSEGPVMPPTFDPPPSP